MKRTFNLWILTLVVITLTFWSCKKQNQPTDNQDTTSVSDNALADETFTDIFTNVNATVSENPGLFSSDPAIRATAAAAAGTYRKHLRYRRSEPTNKHFVCKS